MSKTESKKWDKDRRCSYLVHWKQSKYIKYECLTVLKKQRYSNTKQRTFT